MKQLGRVPALDGLRGVAILLVVGAHVAIPAAGWFHAGTFGVDLFFVLSGFLITTLLLEERARTGTVSLVAFYRRRARRLLPALFVAIGLAALLALAISPGHWPWILLAFAARASYISNFLVAFTHYGVDGDSFRHLWSLAQEEQFYLVWPPLLLAFLRRSTSAVRILLLVALAILAVNVDRWFALHSDPARVWASPDTHGDPILFGCAAAIVRFYFSPRVPRVAGVGAFGFGVGALVWYDHGVGMTYPVALPVFAFACAALILALVDRPESRLARLVSLAPLRFAGRVSYAWYLWNSPLIGAFGPAAGGEVSLAVAALSYRFVEQPFLRGHVLSARPWGRVARALA